MAKGAFASSTFKSRTFAGVTWAGPAAAVTPLTLVWADRTHQTSTTAGTGPLTLSGAVLGKRLFSAVMNAGEVCYGFAAEQNGPAWEVTQFTMNADGTLTRGVYSFAPDGTPNNTGLPLASSAGGAPVPFSGTTLDVQLDVPARVLAASLVTPNFAAVAR